MRRGAVHVPKPEAANEQGRTGKKNKSFSFQQNLHISSRYKALSSVNGQKSVLKYSI